MMTVNDIKTTKREKQKKKTKFETLKKLPPKLKRKPGSQTVLFSMQALKGVDMIRFEREVALCFSFTEFLNL